MIQGQGTTAVIVKTEPGMASDVSLGLVKLIDTLRVLLGK